MLKQITLDNFKCFEDKRRLPLAQITIMYGRNGRGKSTVAQSLLLLAQTMVANNDISNLQLTGKYVKLGSFADVINSHHRNQHFKLSIGSEDEVIEMEFEEYPNKPQLARINLLNVNGKSRFDEISESTDKADFKIRSISTTSDIKSLQTLKLARYISAGRLGPQNSVVRKDNLDDDDLGVNGENLIHVLSRNGIDFLDRVENILSYVLGGASIKINYKDSERLELYLNSKNNSETFRPVNVGFGYSYVLPVIVAALLARNDSLLIIENPEAHLHPGAQSRIMQFLIQIAKEKNLQLLIETHSDHVVNGIRIAMKENILKSNDAHILYFSDETTQVRVITSDRNGTLSDFPDDFLDEWTLQMLKLV